MTLEEFEEWFMNLPLQTLTDELKDDILVNVIAMEKSARDDVRLKINKEVNDFIKKYNI
jgi:uncharacterized protein YihD (DUF1040 family)